MSVINLNIRNERQNEIVTSNYPAVELYVENERKRIYEDERINGAHVNTLVEILAEGPLIRVYSDTEDDNNEFWIESGGQLVLASKSKDGEIVVNDFYIQNKTNRNKPRPVTKGRLFYAKMGSKENAMPPLLDPWLATDYQKEGLTGPIKGSNVLVAPLGISKDEKVLNARLAKVLNPHSQLTAELEQIIDDLENNEGFLQSFNENISKLLELLPRNINFGNLNSMAEYKNLLENITSYNANSTEELTKANVLDSLRTLFKLSSLEDLQSRIKQFKDVTRMPKRISKTR